MLGEEDATIETLGAYSTSCKCMSTSATVLCINRDDFMKLKNHAPTWNQLQAESTSKLGKIDDKVAA